ncbi:MAG: hypothetical protein CMG63_04805 [Candidatus Marinimicrobia bacterium]|nr:hypothetical protein [Candidatus Neomarinimicrobiota bacterium]|tara:strand:- start:236 stop:913 length:678 start_codon:yes stop_codon:yes gene_type:complete
MKNYSILIPIHNEEKFIPDLLNSLTYFIERGHEIIVIDDGSTDRSKEYLRNFGNINLVSIITNKGKGYALRAGLQRASYKRIIIFDGDMELHPSEIIKLMILDKENGRLAAMGYRFRKLNLFRSRFDFGNFIFTTFFNILFNTNHKDVLCCAKAFYIEDIRRFNTKSNSFDIDIELSAFLTLLCKNGISQVSMKYKRRDFQEGKKLEVFDGWKILLRIIKFVKYF